MNKAKIKNFYDLNVWKNSRLLVKIIYETTETFPKTEIYGIINQLRRAALSVTANIAEGFGRFHYKEKIKFYLQARGSILEIQNFIILAYDLNFIDKEMSKQIFSDCNIILLQLNSLIKSTKNLCHE
jgi:four helix bundle protein